MYRKIPNYLVLFILAYCIVSGTPVENLFPTEKNNKIRVLIVDGFSNHDWQRTTILIKKILTNAKIFDISISTAPSSYSSDNYLTWCPRFDDYNVVIQTCNDINHSGPYWNNRAQEAFVKFVKQGGGVYVFHSGNNAFPNWPEYNKMIGLAWRKKEYGTALQVQNNGSLVKIGPGLGENTSHGPKVDRLIHTVGDDIIHHSMPPVWLTPQIEVQTYARGPSDNVHVLSFAEDARLHKNWPIEWYVNFSEGRVYCSTFGHIWRNDKSAIGLECIGFQTLLVRTIQWLAKRPVDFAIPIDFPTANATSTRSL
jgi:type 1 glutamine amidotransferase